MSPLYVPDAIVITHNPVTTLKIGNVTVPVDIITVLANATTSFFFGVISIGSLTITDPVSIDPVFVGVIGTIDPVSIFPVNVGHETTGSVIIITPVFVSSPELLVTTPVSISEILVDLIILTETSGIMIPPVTVGISIFLSSTPVKIEPVSITIEPVFSIMIPVLTHIGEITSVFSVIIISSVIVSSTSFCGRNISSDIHSSEVFMNNSRFSPPRILSIGSRG